MIERLKTIVLTILVLLSLMQSFFLAYSTPNFDVRKKSTNNYISTDPLGSEERVENIIYPEKIFLHLGEGKHTVLYPSMTFYNKVFKHFQRRLYAGFQLHSPSIEWNNTREDSEGVELVFNSPIPIKLLQKVFLISSESVIMNESICKIGFYTMKDKKGIRVFFFNAKGDVLYEANRTDLTEQDIKQQVAFRWAWTPYKSVKGAYYVPDKLLELPEVTLRYDQITAEQMQRNLFNDPTITKKIETGNSEIYTDVKRGLKINRSLQWLTYSNPVVQTEGQQNITLDVTAAVRFINQHGGWNGRFRIASLEYEKGEGAANEQGKIVRFQQYWNSCPIISTSLLPFGYIQVTVQRETVTSYERSLIQLPQQVMKKEMRKLPTGDTLVRKITELSKKKLIAGLDPVYVPILEKDLMRLSPTWQVKYRDGSTSLLDGNTRK